jgi:hypothetical protein
LFQHLKRSFEISKNKNWGDTIVSPLGFRTLACQRQGREAPCAQRDLPSGRDLRPKTCIWPEHLSTENNFFAGNKLAGPKVPPSQTFLNLPLAPLKSLASALHFDATNNGASITLNYISDTTSVA